MIGVNIKYFKTKEEREPFITWAKNAGYIELSRGKLVLHRSPKEGQYWVSVVHKNDIEEVLR